MNMKRYKYIIAFVLAFMALPMMAQDYMNIFFKNGDFRKFYMKNITEIVATKVDAEGVEHEDYSYQQITTIYDKYIYKLEDVDSITFTKIDEELAEHNFVTAMPQVFSAIGDCETIADVEKHLPEIQHMAGVEKAWTDGNQLFIKIAESETFSFFFDPYSDMSDNFDSFPIMDFLSKARGIVKPDKSTITAVLINQQHKDKNRSYKISACENVVKVFEACGIEADYVDEPTVDFFYNNSSNPKSKHLYDYDLIMLSAHGFYGRQYYYSSGNNFIEGLKCHSFLTAEDIEGVKIKAKIQTEDDSDDPGEKWKKYYKNFRDWREKKSYDDVSESHLTFGFAKELRDNTWYWVGHPLITEYFFRDVAKGTFKNPNSIMFNDACQSLMGDDESSDRFAKILFGKGLGQYLGYTETNCTGFSAGLRFYLNMLAGMSVEQSRESLASWFKEETPATFKEGEIDMKAYGAQLLILPEEKDKNVFLFPVHTVPTNNETVMSQYNSEGCLEIAGTTSFANINGGTPIVPSGFRYGLSSDNLSKSINREDLYKTSNNIVHFSAKLTKLEPDKTYYYCAYTFDGKYYNYGDTCSFTTPKITPVIEDLHIDAASIELIVGESKTITITSGNGDYTVKSSNESVATASVNGTTVTVRAISTGSKVVITVIDSKSGQTATVYVTVTEAVTPIDENSEDVIDLGLPSGMLWASCNLGATKPEEIGEYYAWGEISPNWYDASGQYSMDISHSGMGLRWDMTKYCTKEKYGTVDNKISLDLKDDVVHVVLKGRYRMPSWQDYEELITNCTTEWTALNGVNGCQFKGPNGKTIFFPATGVWMYGDLEHLDSYCNYWSRSLYTKLPYKASILCAFDESVWGGGDPVCVHREERYKCKPIRAVMLPEGSPSNLVDFALSGNVNPIIGLGEKCKLNVVSGNGSYTSSSKHPSIANVSINNNVIEITGQNPGTTIIYITDKCSGQDIMVTVTVTPKTETPAAAVDLGLPSGTKWASYNLGATRPEDYGGYYAWGELEKKDSYSWNTYLHCDGEDYSCYELPNDISGTVYDIVKMKWGGSWRMPTVDDFYELSDNCQIEWVSRSGTKGCLITGPNGNSIFLPASGWVDGETKKNVNEYGLFWTPCLIDYNTDYGKSLGGSLDEIGVGGAIGDRYAGYSIRPVIK